MKNSPDENQFSTPNIIDTFRLDSNGIFLKELHLQRTFHALQNFCSGSVNATLLDGIYKQVQPTADIQKCRFIFAAHNWQNPIFESAALDAVQTPVKLELSKLATQKSGLGNLQNFKTSKRTYWDQSMPLKNPAADDIIGINDLGFITETSRFNIFLKRDSAYYTPSLDSGCINGVYRQHLMTNTELIIIESAIRPEELQHFEIYVANSVRGLLPAQTVSM